MSTPPTEWHDVASVDDLSPGEVIEVVVAGQMVAIANVEGKLYATDGLCAHQGGPLGKGSLAGCTLTCPWHGWQYDVTSGWQKLSQTIRQATFAVRVQGDRIAVRSQPTAA